MDYMEDSKMEVLNYLRKQKVDIAALDEALEALDDVIDILAEYLEQ